MAVVELICRHLGLRDYAQTAAAMRQFTETRTPATPDELWLLQHPPVFTQGQAGRPEHLLAPGDIPVISSNRGGQVTYHGPGQLVAYALLDLRRLGLSPRALVTLLEAGMIEVLAAHGLLAHARPEAPGVYLRRDFGHGEDVRKIGSIGLRVSRGCSYHGLSLNVAMNLEPFGRINPCGFAGLRMTQMAELAGTIAIDSVADSLCITLRRRLADRAR